MLYVVIVYSDIVRVGEQLPVAFHWQNAELRIFFLFRKNANSKKRVLRSLEWLKNVF